MYINTTMLFLHLPVQSFNRLSTHTSAHSSSIYPTPPLCSLILHLPHPSPPFTPLPSPVPHRRRWAIQTRRRRCGRASAVRCSTHWPTPLPHPSPPFTPLPSPVPHRRRWAIQTRRRRCGRASAVRCSTHWPTPLPHPSPPFTPLPRTPSTEMSDPNQTS